MKKRLAAALCLTALLLLPACDQAAFQSPSPSAPSVQSESPELTPAPTPEPSAVPTPEIPPDPYEEERLGFTGGNIHGGLMAGDGEGWVYYRSEADHWQLYKARLDGSDRELLVEGAHLEYYYRGTVYCGFPNAFGLQAYDLETGELTSLVDQNRYLEYVTVDDTGIYYWTPNEYPFFRLDPSTGEETQILRDYADYFNYTGGTLYYYGYGGDAFNYRCIYALDVTTGEKRVVLSLSDQYFDREGNLLGLTIADYRNGSWDSEAIPIDSYGQPAGLTEQASDTYVIEGYVFSRGILRNAVLPERTDVTGVLDCWILCDGVGGLVWD